MTDQEIDDECRRARIHELLLLLGGVKRTDQVPDVIQKITRRLDELDAFGGNWTANTPPT